ncbi:DUF7167 family protein [Bacillus chungangensis]|uniref:DUF7167 domain-containing protein n=1 Tax=Bacillus chungangensis TaxID=587633 RepID=A0ABT9WMH9_9BACI|nr:hypothetical protein [Bacillus chungangensis]MDQ0174461.1 hypothetical protein [Bacillus chungangensis]
MKTYKFFLHTGFAGCTQEEIVELPSDLSEEEVEEEFKDWVWNLLDGHYEELERREP